MTGKKIALYAVGGIVAVILILAIWMLGPALLPPKPIDAGIAVGDKVPIEMPLKDSEGKATTLGQQMGDAGMVLLFVRSADWCPFCKAQLARTEEISGQVSAKAFSLAGLSYDDPGKLAQFAGENDVSFALLSDKGSKMIDALGLRDPQYEEGSFAYGVPRASILFLGTDGTVLEKYVAADYRSRPSNEDILAILSDVAP